MRATTIWVVAGIALAGCGAVQSAPAVGDPAASCTDQIANGDESDTDCGGSCSPCGASRACAVDVDCESGTCTDDRCAVPPSCTDGVQNDDETDVDCGGKCSQC